MIRFLSQAGFEEKLENKLNERDRDIQRRLATLENKKPSPTRTVPETTPRQNESYGKARKSLKIWPVSGPDLEDSLKVLLWNKLKLDDERIRTLGAISVKHSVGRGAKERSEVLADSTVKRIGTT